MEPVIIRGAGANDEIRATTTIYANNDTYSHRYEIELTSGSDLIVPADATISCNYNGFTGIEVTAYIPTEMIITNCKMMCVHECVCIYW